MAIIWEDCFLCHGYGRIDIGENYTDLLQTKNLKCPHCNGAGRLGMKSNKENPWDLNRGDFL